MAPGRGSVAVATLALLALVTSAAPAGADADLEAQVMAKIRASRSGGLVVHSGLLAVARGHSMDMARQGGMSHDDADARITNAPPDPFEADGAPDDGFGVASWCENVTYSTAHPRSEVAGRIYSQWEGSGAHGRCMRDASRNVGAVGIYFDGTTWWATFIAQVDETPPGGAQPKATSAPKPPAAGPAATPAPAPTASSEPEGAADAAPGADHSGSAAPEPGAEEAADDVVTTQDAPAIDVDAQSGNPWFIPAEPAAPVAAASAGYGWQEVSALVAVMVLASFAGRRRLRRRPALGEDPAPIEHDLAEIAPERELVGAGVRS